MKIVLYTTRFAPSIGGMESVARLLVEAWVASGDTVTVVVGGSKSHPVADGLPNCGNDSEANGALRVLRVPSYRTLLRVVRDADVVVQFNITIPTTWFLRLFARRLVVAHHTWYASGSRVRDVLKQLTSCFTVNIAVSEQVREHILGRRTIVIPNPYDSAIFHPRGRVEGNRSRILYVGRLVSDKGVDTLVRAVARLLSSGVQL
jgi:glycosyltransferase involved in cell wall biosynthesis